MNSAVCIAIIVGLVFLSWRLYVIGDQWRREASHWRKRYLGLTGGEYTLEDFAPDKENNG